MLLASSSKLLVSIPYYIILVRFSFMVHLFVKENAAGVSPHNRTADGSSCLSLSLSLLQPVAEEKNWKWVVVHSFYETIYIDDDLRRYSTVLYNEGSLRNRTKTAVAAA